MENRRGVQEGMIVYSADGEKLGKVFQCEADSFIIEKGFFFPKDYIARYDDIQTVNGDEIRLSRGKEWFTGDRDMREGETLGARSSVGGESYGYGASANTTEHDRGPGLKEKMKDKLGMGEHGDERWTGERRTSGTEDVRVPIAEEELDVTKRDRQTGEVQVRKDVVTEHKRVDVPVMKERVRVEHVPATDQTAASGDAAFRKDTISVPVHEEEVEIRKRPVVKEEVRVRKERQVEQRAADAELRKERVDIEGDGQHTVRDDDITGRGPKRE